MFRSHLISLVLITYFLNSSSVLAQDHTYLSENNGINVQAKVIPQDQCRNLFKDFPHDDAKYQHYESEVSTVDAYKYLFSKDLVGDGIYLIGVSITNTGNKPVYLTQESIALKLPVPESKQCLIDQKEVSKRKNLQLWAGIIIPVIGWLLLFSITNLKIGQFLDEYGIPTDGLTLEPGKTFRTIFFVDNHEDRQIAPAPNSFDMNLKVYTQLSWYNTQYTEFNMQLLNNNRRFV